MVKVWPLSTVAFESGVMNSLNGRDGEKDEFRLRMLYSVRRERLEAQEDACEPRASLSAPVLSRFMSRFKSRGISELVVRIMALLGLRTSSGMASRFEILRSGPGKCSGLTSHASSPMEYGGL